MSTPVHLRNVPWPAEIFDHPNFISSIAKWYRPELFVEYGTGLGEATRVYAPFCKRIIGVDLNRSVTNIPNLTLYNMTTREFKTKVLDSLGIIDMAFIDADHKWESAFQDFEDIFPHIIENGIIFLHDTFPCEEKWTDEIFSGDSWVVPYKIKEKYGKACEVLTVPIQPGLTMVKKCTTQLEHMRYVPKVMNRLGFIVAVCLWTEEHRKSWEECLKSIRKFHPVAPIIAILDKSSVLEINNSDPYLQVEKPTIDVASDMLTYYYFLKQNSFETVVTLQDSMKLLVPVTEERKAVSYLWSFTNHRTDWSKIREPESQENTENNIKTHDDLVLYCINKHVKSLDFLQYALSTYRKKDEWVGCFGCLTYSSKDFIRILDERTGIIDTMKSMGRDNRKRRAIESIFSLSVQYVLGYVPEVYDGLYFDGETGGHKLKGEKIEKVSHNRVDSVPGDVPKIIATGDSQCIHFWKIAFVTEHWLGFNTVLPITINRLGKEGLDIGTIHTALGNGHERFPVKPGDTVLYCYGYNDIQYRVFQQVEEGRKLEDVLEELVTGYFKTVLENEEKFRVSSCIYNILPPPCKPIEFKVAGSTEERIVATNMINSMLRKKCEENNVKFFDIYDRCVNSNGTLKNELSKDGIHLDSEYYYFLEEKLREIFSKEICSVVKTL